MVHLTRRQLAGGLAMAPLLEMPASAMAAPAPLPILAPVLAPSLPLPRGLLGAYGLNRKLGRPNLITESLLIHGLELTRRRAQIAQERAVLAPALASWITALAGQDSADPIARDFLSVLLALSHGEQTSDRPAVQAELARIAAADTIARSAITGLPLDYTQLRPRGHYAGDPVLERYFRSFRYASALAFLLVPSRATGLARRQAQRLGAAAVALSHLASATPQTSAFFALLQTGFGEAEDFGPLDLPSDLPDAAVPAAWVRDAAALGRLPGVIDVLYDTRHLGDKTPAQVAISWRLLPGRRLPDVAAMQALAHPATGAWQGTGPLPFDAGAIGGQVVKAYVGLDDMLALLAPQAPAAAPFAGLPAALTAQRDILLGRGNDTLRLLRAGLDETAPPPFRLQALGAAYAHYRHGMVLVAKQSYSGADKGITLNPARPGALLATTPAFLRALGAHADALARRFADPAWGEWGVILRQLEDVAYLQARRGPTAAADTLLNALDLRIAALIDPAHDRPFIVDIHTCPAEGKVVELGTAAPLAIMAGNAVGAILPVCQFKHPMADRLTDTRWGEMLSAGQPSDYVWRAL